MDLSGRNRKAILIDETIKTVVKLILGFISRHGIKAEFKKYIETTPINATQSYHRAEVYLTLNDIDVYGNWDKLTGRKDKPIVNENCISIYQETIHTLKFKNIYNEIELVEFYEILKRIEIAILDWVELSQEVIQDIGCFAEVTHHLTETFDVMIPEEVLENFYGNPMDDFIGDLD